MTQMARPGGRSPSVKDGRDAEDGGCLVGTQAVLAQEKPIVRGAQYHILDAQNGEQWAAEDKDLDAPLAALRQKYGRPPNIIHLMWDDQPFGSVGIPALQ